MLARSIVEAMHDQRRAVCIQPSITPLRYTVCYGRSFGKLRWLALVLDTVLSRYHPAVRLRTELRLAEDFQAGNS